MGELMMYAVRQLSYGRFVLGRLSNHDRDTAVGAGNNILDHPQGYDVRAVPRIFDVPQSFQNQIGRNLFRHNANYRRCWRAAESMARIKVPRNAAAFTAVGQAVSRSRR